MGLSLGVLLLAGLVLAESDSSLADGDAPAATKDAGVRRRAGTAKASVRKPAPSRKRTSPDAGLPPSVSRKTGTTRTPSSRPSRSPDVGLTRHLPKIGPTPKGTSSYLPYAWILLGLLLIVLAWGAHRWAVRARRRLPPSVWVPRLADLAGTLSALVGAYLLIQETIILTPWVKPEVRWGGLFGLALLVVWVSHGFVPDLLGSMVILFERRIRPGMRVERAHFAGTVIGTGWRSTRLRTPGGILDVPNRELMSGPVRISGAAEHELVLHLAQTQPATQIRRQIEDAVIASAWTPPAPNVRVHRDPKDERRWVVHTRLLDPRHAPAFDADLPERLEAILPVASHRSEVSGSDGPA